MFGMKSVLIIARDVTSGLKFCSHFVFSTIAVNGISSNLSIANCTIILSFNKTNSGIYKSISAKTFCPDGGAGRGHCY